MISNRHCVLVDFNLKESRRLHQIFNWFFCVPFMTHLKFYCGTRCCWLSIRFSLPKSLASVNRTGLLNLLIQTLIWRFLVLTTSSCLVRRLMNNCWHRSLNYGLEQLLVFVFVTAWNCTITWCYTAFICVHRFIYFLFIWIHFKCELALRIWVLRVLIRIWGIRGVWRMFIVRFKRRREIKRQFQKT